MRHLLSLLAFAVLLGCGDALSGGAREPIAPGARLPAPPSSVVFGPQGAPTGGTLVVGILVPTPPPARLVDLVGKARMDAFLEAEAARAGEPEEEVEIIEEWEVEPNALEIDTHRKRYKEAADAVQKATHVQVIFRDVLAHECDGVPVVLASGKVEHEADREALRPWLEAGGRLFCDACFQHDLGESRPGVRPDERGKSSQALVDTCLEILETSTLVARLPHDPREVVKARRDGDDVFVAFRSPPANVSVRDLADVEVADVMRLADGRLRFTSPNTPGDPFFHRLVATWRGEGWTLRRAWRVVDLVGVVERFVFAPNVVEAGATYAPRILFLNSLTGGPVVGRPAHVALLRKDAVLSEATGKSDVAGSVAAVLHVPADLPTGSATLQVGEDRFHVRIRRGLRIAVVTDRTLYRPTDEVCVRVMVHDTAQGRPVAGQDVVLHLGDEERTVTTSVAGIASARMRLVDARLGPSKIQASIDGVQATAAFKVNAFERPTFLVTTSPERLVLRPGESAPVVVHVHAVNGSPLVGAKVYVWTGSTQAKHGLTDAAGAFAFDARWDPEASAYRVVVTAVDGRHTEVRVPVLLEGEDRTLTFRPLEEPIVGRPCRIEITASVAGPVHLTDGEGARHDVTVEAGRPAVVEVTPSGPRSWLRLSSGLADTGELPIRAATVPAGVPLILPAARLATVGDTLRLSLEGEGGPVYVDVLRDGTVLRALSAVLQQGRADLDLPLGADLAGILELRAWNLDGDGTPRGSRVPVLVVRGRSLVVDAKAERASYRPGETAVVDVDVRDHAGEPTAAVLGYWGVDEALLALSPWHEATEDIFDAVSGDPTMATLDLARRAEHGASPPFERALSVLGPLSASEDLGTSFALQHRSAPALETAEMEARRAMLDAHEAALRETVLEAIEQLPLDALRTAHSLREVFDRLVREGIVAADAFRDPWGSSFDIREVMGYWKVWNERDGDFFSWSSSWGYPLISPGPDLKPARGDDLIYVWVPPAPCEIGGRVGRFLEMVWKIRQEAGESAGFGAPFFGPVNHGLIGLGGGAGGAFRGRGGSRATGRASGMRASQPVHLRRDFSPTLCFVPEAIVGPGGHARLAIPLKDSITTWRLRLVASGTTGATGVGESTIRVNQPLHANPWIAPHLTVGDVLELPVAVHNETAALMDVSLALSVSPELEILSASKVDVRVTAHGSAAHVFRYRAVGRGRARVRVDATSPVARDAIERIVSVCPREREVVEVLNGAVSSDTPWGAVFAALDAGVDREVGVSVYPSPLAETLSGFEGLIACPHG